MILQTSPEVTDQQDVEQLERINSRLAEISVFQSELSLSIGEIQLPRNELVQITRKAGEHARFLFELTAAANDDEEMDRASMIISGFLDHDENVEDFEINVGDYRYYCEELFERVLHDFGGQPQQVFDRYIRYTETKDGHPVLEKLEKLLSSLEGYNFDEDNMSWFDFDSQGIGYREYQSFRAWMMRRIAFAPARTMMKGGFFLHRTRANAFMVGDFRMDRAERGILESDKLLTALEGVHRTCTSVLQSIEMLGHETNTVDFGSLIREINATLPQQVHLKFPEDVEYPTLTPTVAALVAVESIHEIINNSIKYKSGDEVNIEIHIEAMTRNEHAVKVIIRDDGLGIPENELKLLKARTKDGGIFRASNVTDLSGTGTGLATIRRELALGGSSLDIRNRDDDQKGVEVELVISGILHGRQLQQ